MGNVNVAVVLFYQHILTNLISNRILDLGYMKFELAVPVNEDVVKMKVHDKVNQRLLDP